MRRHIVTYAALVLLVAAGVAWTSPFGPSAQPAGARTVEALLADPALQAALAGVEADEPSLLDEQAALTEIPSPPFGEQARAARLAQIFATLGLQHVRIDDVGNVIGERPGLAPRPNLVVSAHLDTVFPAGTPVTVTREGAVLRAPGICDDGRGLAVMAGVVRALNRGNVRTPGTITFVGTVGEEGLGDLRGVKHLFGHELKGRIDAFISIDGSGHGVTNVAVGSHRYRVTVKGPGGHSFGAFGTVNPIHALGRAIARVAEFDVPQAPRVTFNVGRIGGGTSINAIATEAWFESDMRSSDAAALSSIDASFRDAVDRAVRAENERWQAGRLEADVRLVGDRPAGRTPENAAIVRTAAAVNRGMGLPVELGEGSTDANIPISLGIPAITVGGGGQSSGVHSLSESFDSTGSWKGTARVTALVFALAR